MIIQCQTTDFNSLRIDAIVLEVFYKKSDHSVFCKEIKIRTHRHVQQNSVGCSISADDLIGVPLRVVCGEIMKFCVVLKNGKVILTSDEQLIDAFSRNKSLARAATNLEDFKAMVSL